MAILVILPTSYKTCHYRCRLEEWPLTLANKRKHLKLLGILAQIIVAKSDKQSSPAKKHAHAHTFLKVIQVFPDGRILSRHLAKLE